VFARAFGDRCTSQHAGYFLDAGARVQYVDARTGDSAGYMFRNAQLVICLRSHLRQVGDAEHRPPRRAHALPAHHFRHGATDARIDSSNTGMAGAPLDGRNLQQADSGSSPPMPQANGRGAENCR
jgi:hypothetical protein